MVKKEQIQDPSGNIIYWHTSSDVVFNEETGATVKQEIDEIRAAIGLSSSSVSEPTINAGTLNGHPADDFVLSETYINVINALTQTIQTKAPLESPVFTGTPTAPNVEKNDSSEKIANTNFVQNVLKDYAEKTHSHAASEITAGTFKDTGVVAKNGADYSTSRIRNISLISASDALPTGLENGSVVMVYSED